MKRMIKVAAWLMAASLIFSFILVPAKPASATTYKYEWVSQSGTVSPDGYAHQYTSLKAGDLIPLSLTLINRSGTTIVGKGNLPTIPGYQVPIGVWGVGTQNPQDGSPYFLDTSSFILNNNRFVYYDGANVPDGGYFTLNWTVKLADNLSDGVYDLYYRPVCEYLAWTRQYKNGHTLLGTDSDIFTRFIVGSGISTTYKTYINSVFGFSFQYPANYTVRDNLPKTWVATTGPAQPLEISSSESQKPGLQMYVNPDGWGPIFSDIIYKISPQQGKIVVSERSVVPDDEAQYNDDGKILITTRSDSEKSFGGNDYWFLFGFEEGTKDYEPVFKQILASFRYTIFTYTNQ